MSAALLLELGGRWATNHGWLRASDAVTRLCGSHDRQDATSPTRLVSSMGNSLSFSVTLPGARLDLLLPTNFPWELKNLLAMVASSKHDALGYPHTSN